ncbi:hypothetical protein Aph01nite_08330 [Acrocarpospora phusangensis]|uniref:DUF2637 domain-containing protein n=1 Tax=Acrocarpospora phusangensis TaxID=1070424 RepID=A0A919Q5W7_9ACTN|nr:hypothetical protein [Acrocarpospora phusangensis]GIH22523.1 hypothetical protein Aph01nite_08330 [Acrocarpospora phusangensis]
MTTTSHRRLWRSRVERAADKADARARAAQAKLDAQRIRAQADAEKRQAAVRRPARPLEDKLTLAAATIATVVAGQGMWTFLERVLGPQYANGQVVDPGIPVWLRALMFAFVEVAVVTSAVRARRNMREKLSAGIDGLAVWALTGVSAVLAATEARSLPEVLFRLAAPLIAAWLWERGMAIERHRLTGRGRIHWRWTPERILVRLGVAEPTERTAGEVDAQRRLTKAALAADRVADLSDGWRKQRALKSLKRRGRAMVTHTSVATDAGQQAYLMAQISTARAIGRLAEAGGSAFWEVPTVPLPVPSTDDDPTSIRALEGHTGSSIEGTREGRAGIDNEIATEATGEPVADVDGDGRDRPNEQDNRVAEKWLRERIRAGRMPTLSDIETKYGFGRKWARLRAQSARDQMAAQGYRFLPGNAVLPPSDESPSEVASANGTEVSSSIPMAGVG